MEPTIRSVFCSPEKRCVCPGGMAAVREGLDRVGKRGGRWDTGMARCDRGYLCEVCGEPVPEITDSDLYLRFVLGELDSRLLLAAPERHLRCNPVQAQFIVDPEFEPVLVDGPFDKRHQDPTEVRQRETRVTAAFRRLRELPGSGLPLSAYPLPPDQGF